MDYQQSLAYMRSLEKLGIRFRLENTRELLQKTGFKYHGLTVHVAGTNGKGSCAATLASILTASGKRTGLYTSPELLDFRERIRIDGIMISPERFSEIASHLIPHVESMAEKPTFFEATTAIALKYFADERVDAMVLEAGMGGRLDSTRAVDGALSIVTSVSLDHMQYLGSTVSEIAFEKSGIITPNTCFVTSAKEPALSVLHRESIKKRAELFRLGKEFRISDVTSTINGTSFTLTTKNSAYSLNSRLVGDFQAENIACAAVAAEKLGVSKNHIIDGVSKVSWKGRMQVVSERPLVIVDCAHNPDGVRSVMDYIESRMRFKRLIVVAGFSRDKDYDGMLKRLGKADLILATKYNNPRSLEPAKILEKTRAIAFENVDDALNHATSISHEGDLVLVLGSIYLAGEALRHFGVSDK